jgi:site-specific DNA-methyltransferase (adenine-specific)
MPPSPGAANRRTVDRMAGDGVLTGPDTVHEADNLVVLGRYPDRCVQMVYVDPPFNTGKVQRRTTMRTPRDPDGDRIGFQGRRHATVVHTEVAYRDVFDDYLGFLRPRLAEAWRLLADTGTMYVHLDYREVHHVKVMLDGMLGRHRFLNEIVWAYDFGARSKRRWPTKHDTILVYVKDPDRYWFDASEVDREPYMAPGLVGPEKAAAGKLPTDVWWHTIVSPTGREKTGYPNQKPEAVIRRMVTASTRPGDWVLDCFAGSGTTGAVAQRLGRRFVMVDHNPEAVEIMRRRLVRGPVTFVPGPPGAGRVPLTG